MVVRDLSNDGKNGRLNLVLGVKDGKTIVKNCFQKVPLKISIPFYSNNSKEIILYQLTPTGGGMVQGDRYNSDIYLERGAELFYTNQSATKIYRAPKEEVRQYTNFKLEEDTFLEYSPEVVIPFAEAKFFNETNIFMARSSMMILTEIIAPGRMHRQEVFKFTEIDSLLKVYIDNEIAYFDRFHLTPQEQLPSVLGLFDKYSFIGNFLVFAGKNDRTVLHKKLQETIKKFPTVFASCSLLEGNGIVLRALGSRTMDLEDIFRECSKLTRKIILGKEEVHLRKY